MRRRSVTKCRNPSAIDPSSREISPCNCLLHWLLSPLLSSLSSSLSSPPSLPFLLHCPRSLLLSVPLHCSFFSLSLSPLQPLFLYEFMRGFSRAGRAGIRFYTIHCAILAENFVLWLTGKSNRQWGHMPSPHVVQLFDKVIKGQASAGAGK